MDNRDILKALEEQLNQAIRQGNKSKKLELEKAIQAVNKSIKDPTLPLPDLSRWGIDSSAPSGKSHVELVETVIPIKNAAAITVEELPLVIPEIPAKEPAQTLPAADELVEQPEVEESATVEAGKPGDFSGPSQPSTAGKASLLPFYESLPENFAELNNDQLKTRMESLDELEARRDSYPDIQADEWNTLAGLIHRLQAEKQHRLDIAYNEIQKKIDEKGFADALALTHQAMNLLSISENNSTLNDYLKKCLNEVKLTKNIHGWHLDLQEFAASTDHVHLKQIIERLTIPFRDGLFPEDLNDSFLKAQEKLDQLRRTAGVHTSQMRLGDLRQKWDSHQYWLKIIEDTKKALDDNETLAVNLENEAKLLWEEESRKSMDSVIASANVYFTSSPDLSLSYLRNNVGELDSVENVVGKQSKLYSPADLGRFRTYYLQVKERVGNLEQARQLLEQADLSPDAFHRFINICNAKKKFSDYNDINNLIEGERPLAIRALEDQLARYLEQAGTAAGLRKYRPIADQTSDGDNSQSYIQRAADQIGLWPEINLPDELENRRKEIERLSKALLDQERRYHILLRDIGKINTLANNGEKQNAFDAFKILKENSDNNDFTAEIKALESRLDSLRSYNEQVEIIRKEVGQEKPDWNSLLERSNKLLKELEPGTDLYRTTTQLRDQARINIYVTRIKISVQNRNIPAAQTLLNLQGMNTPEVKEQLKDEFATIHEAEANTPALEVFYKKALTGQNAKDVKKQYHAYQLFRYLAGFPEQVEDENDLSPYKLSEKTWDALIKSSELEIQFNSLLKELRKAREAGTRYGNLAQLNDYANVLYKAHLLKTEDDKKIAEWAVETYTNSLEEPLLGDGNLAEAIKLWEAVKPRFFAMGERRILNAQIIWAMREANKDANLREYEQALAALNSVKAQARGDPRFDIVLSNTYKDLNRYDDAIAALQSDPKVATPEKTLSDWIKEYENRRLFLLIQRRVYEFLNALEAFIPRLETCLQNYQAGENESRAITILQVSEITEQIFGEYRKIHKDNEVSKQKEFLEKWKELHLKFLDILTNLFDQESRIDQASSLNVLILIKELESGYAPEVNQDVLFNDIQEYIEKYPYLFEELDKNIKGRSNGAGRIDRLIIDRKSWLWEIKGFLRSNLTRTQIQTLSGYQSDLSQELTDYQRLKAILISLDNPGNWKQTAERFVADSPLAIDQSIEAMNTFKMPDIVEVSNINKKYSDWKDILGYLSRKITELNSLLNTKNDETAFDSVVNEIDQIEQYSIIRTQKPELSLPEEEYQTLFSWYSQNVKIAYGPGRVVATGWEQVKSAAMECKENLAVWMAWGNEFHTRYIRINDLQNLTNYLDKGDLPFPKDDAFEKALDAKTGLSSESARNLKYWLNEYYDDWCRQPALIHTSKTLPLTKEITIPLSKEMASKVPLQYRVYLLEDFLQDVDLVMQYFNDGPDQKGIEEFPQKSHLAKQVYSASASSYRDLQKIRVKIVRVRDKSSESIQQKGDYPTRAELDELKKNAGAGSRSYRERLQAAEEIGPGSLEEWQAYYYHHVGDCGREEEHKDASQKRGRFFWKDLVERLRDVLGF